MIWALLTNIASKKENDLSVSLHGRYAADIVDVPAGSTNLVELDNYFVADLKINYHPTNNTKVFFGIDNITDENYELVANIPASSISVFVGMSWNY